MPPIAPKYSLAAFPVQSGHGDVHTISIGRTDGKSITISDFKWIFYKITGHYLSDEELRVNADWFAEEDRI